jgi:hypothetical protein
MGTTRFFVCQCFVTATALCLLALALAETHEPTFSSRQSRDSQSLSVYHPATDRKLGTRADIATEVLVAVAEKVAGDVAEKEGVRRVYYRRARKQLYWEMHPAAEWARIEEEDAELELMKRQKD